MKTHTSHATPSVNPTEALDVSVVVIGRNEGRRLCYCLGSVRQANWASLRYELIYVDSGSSDGSVIRARRFGAQILELRDTPPGAAAARNLGWQAARAPWVLFLDGDTELDPDFVLHAYQQLQQFIQTPHPRSVVAVWGHRREARPEQSPYTDALDLDWVYPLGSCDYFGGDVLISRQALQEVNGFDTSLLAGEEPELCWRLRAAGGSIEHIDVPMTTHDLGIQHWRAWFKRAQRTGWAYAEIAQRFAHTNDPLWTRQARRNWVHGSAVLLWPLAVLCALVWEPWAALVGLVLGVLVLWRTVRRCTWKCPQQPRRLWRYALHSHLQQVPILLGQIQCHLMRRKTGSDPTAHSHLVQHMDYKTTQRDITRREATRRDWGTS